VAVVLRPATAADMQAVGELYHRSRVAAYRHFIPAEDLESTPAEAVAAWWKERFAYERDTHRYTVAERDGRIVGFTQIGPDEDEPGLVQLYAIHLEPEEQGHGTGRLLMGDALEHLGGRRAVLWVFCDNARARRFYERSGWTPDGRTRMGTIGRSSNPMMRYEHWLGESA
jgi:RimJ/RimL family protein N-acetyltransferase